LETIIIRRANFDINGHNYYGRMTLDIDFVTSMYKGKEIIIGQPTLSLINSRRDSAKAKKIVEELIEHQKTMLNAIEEIYDYMGDAENSDIDKKVKTFVTLARTCLELAESIDPSREDDKSYWLNDKIQLLQLSANEISTLFAMHICKDKQFKEAHCYVVNDILPLFNESFRLCRAINGLKEKALHDLQYDIVEQLYCIG
jgi:hypothetical protein